MSPPTPLAFSQSTTTLLLAELTQRQDESAWREFDRRYRGIIFGLARRAGVVLEDAADIAQQTLADVVEGLRSEAFDRSRGRLRSWILAIARHRIADHFRSRNRRREQRGASALLNAPEERVLAEWWELERRGLIFERALAELRSTSRLSDHTLRVFEAILKHPTDAGAVAQQFDIDTAAVYQIKHRVAARLRAIVQRISERFDDDGLPG